MCLAKGPTKPVKIKCAYWNINGHNSKIIGDKLSDAQFLERISDSDILGLAELHANEEVCVPGFNLIKQKIREKKFKGPKIAGGLAIFVKAEIEHLVQVIPNNNENSIWIKLGKSISGEMEDIYIGTYYVSPPNSKVEKKNPMSGDFFTEFNEEIAIFKKKGGSAGTR